MAHLRIKAGTVEFECEGENSFSIDDIAALFPLVEKLAQLPVVALPSPPAMGTAGGEQLVPKQVTTNSGIKLHVNSVAAKLNAKTGPEVARAAAAYLQIIEGKETFTRAELLATMKSATKYYKSSMSGNLTGAIETLLNGKLNQIGTDVYSLASAEHAALEVAIAQ